MRILKTIIFAFLLVSGVANAQNFDARFLTVRDTLSAGTSTYDTTKWHPQDTTWGYGAYGVRYDSIMVDTLRARWNHVYVNSPEHFIIGVGDSVIFETWDIVNQQWIQIGLKNTLTGTYSNLLYVATNTVPAQYLLDDKAIFFLRRRLVNTGANWDGDRTSEVSIKLLNTY